MGRPGLDSGRDILGFPMPAYRPGTRAALRTLLGAGLVIAVGLGLDWAWGAARQSLQPTGEAEWIWMRNVSRWRGPEAFYAMRDFDIDEVPSRARVVVLGDEEYVLFLNGRRVGGNHYVGGAPLDEYRVEELLTEGTNRLGAHLRSSKGEGAFLLALYLGDSGSPIVVSDDEWKILRRFSRKFFRPWLPIERRERAVVVARPPTGRWGGTSRREKRPLHDELAVFRGGLRARRRFVAAEGWLPLIGRQRDDSSRLGEVVVLDWGQPVNGYLTLRFAGTDVALGLAYFGEQLPDPVGHAPDAYVIGTRGQSYWEDVVPRRFRFVLLAGLTDATEGRVVLTDPEKLRPIPGGEALPGVLGLPAPRLRSPAEDKVWRELERFARQPEG